MLILGIESSCDDSSIALVRDGREVVFNHVSSQMEHAKYQGIVPEIAARKHLDNFTYLLDNLLNENELLFSSIDGIAVTYRPGLNSSLLAGVALAKSLSVILNKPIIGVNHLKAHFYSLLMDTKIKLPFLGLLVSGGHTLLALVRSPLNIKIIGGTLDDACGECLDKIAKYYHMGYPGGPSIEKLAKGGDENFFNFPKPKPIDDSLHFSFSGFKTAVIHHKEKYQQKKITPSSLQEKKNLAASVQRGIFNYLLFQVVKAAKRYGVSELGICGGVAANRYLRNLLSLDGRMSCYFPKLSLCTDNGAMIAGLAFEYWKRRKINQFRELTSNPMSYKMRR